MTIERPILRSPDRRLSAFSVAEMLVAVGLMSVIVIALYSVFNQTQRALRSSESQGDVSERGRSVMDLLVRDLEQMQPSLAENVTNFYTFTPDLWREMRASQAQATNVTARTNLLQDIFMLQRHSNSWVGVGYAVLSPKGWPTQGVGVGTLYRYVSNTFQPRPTHASSNFASLRDRIEADFAAQTFNELAMRPVAEGIVHLRVTAHDRLGYRLGWDTTNTLGPTSDLLNTSLPPGQQTFRYLRLSSTGTRLPDRSSPGVFRTNATVVLQQTYAKGVTAPVIGTETRSSYISNAMPAFLDVELGVLEPDTLRQMEQMAADDLPRQKIENFLTNKISKVQLFRQRIPIRSTGN